jgi:hypothetical protein
MFVIINQPQQPSMTPSCGQQSPVKPNDLHFGCAEHAASEDDFVAVLLVLLLLLLLLLLTVAAGVLLLSSSCQSFMLLSPELFGGPYK